MTQQEFNDKIQEYFSDLTSQEPASWSQEARDWAENAGIFEGDTSGNKMYKKPLTREEMAAILYKLHNKGLI